MIAENETFSVESIAETINRIIDIVAVCFAVFVSFICLLNLFTAIRGRAQMRKKEIAMYRSVGMEQHQLSKMIFEENVYLFVKGVTWAVVASVPMIWGMKKVLTTYFGNLKMGLSVEFYAMVVVSVFVVLILFSKHCYSYRYRDNILEDLKNENI